jgi:hypothetical protein
MLQKVFPYQSRKDKRGLMTKKEKAAILAAFHYRNLIMRGAGRS